MDKLTGLYAATLTPFNTDGSVNYNTIGQQVDFLHAEGVSGIFTCGTTGESSSLTVEERMKLVECYADATKGKLKHIVHVGHNSLEDACALAEHAQSVNADAVSAVAPSYFKVNSVSCLVECCRKIASAAADTPFYYYHIPSFTGCDLPMTDFLYEADDEIKNLAGIKYTHYDLKEFMECRNIQNGRYDILFGRDEYYLASLAFGAQGAVGSTYNYMAPLFIEIKKCYDSGDMQRAREVQQSANYVINLLIEYGGMPTSKALARLRGIDTGICRLPNGNFDNEVECEVHRQAAKILAEYVSIPEVSLV